VACSCHGPWHTYQLWSVWLEVHQTDSRTESRNQPTGVAPENNTRPPVVTGGEYNKTSYKMLHVMQKYSCQYRSIVLHYSVFKVVLCDKYQTVGELYSTTLFCSITKYRNIPLSRYFERWFSIIRNFRYLSGTGAHGSTTLRYAVLSPPTLYKKWPDECIWSVNSICHSVRFIACTWHASNCAIKLNRCAPNNLRSPPNHIYSQLKWV